jgi:rubredoxin
VFRGWHWIYYGGKAVKVSDAQVVIDRLSDVWTVKRLCPVCASSKLSLTNIVEVRDYNEGNHCPGAAITPMVEVVCDVCGYVMLFNAIALGVVDRDTGKVKGD